MLFAGLAVYGDWAYLVLRLALGIIFVYHSFSKLKGPSNLARALGVPIAFSFILGLAELISGLALISGLYAQIAALVTAVIMIGAIFVKIFKFHVGFAGSNTTGWEFDLALLAMSVFLVIEGAGGIVF